VPIKADDPAHFAALFAAQGGPPAPVPAAVPQAAQPPQSPSPTASKENECAQPQAPPAGPAPPRTSTQVILEYLLSKRGVTMEPCAPAEFRERLDAFKRSTRIYK
jgi:hypothetical protein